MIDRQNDIYGRYPLKVALDGGFASKENLESDKAKGVKIEKNMILIRDPGQVGPGLLCNPAPDPTVSSVGKTHHDEGGIVVG